jgi:hypothetical protein
MSTAAANLIPYHTLPLLPSNLAVANLSIETLGVELRESGGKGLQSRPVTTSTTTRTSMTSTTSTTTTRRV